MVKMSIGQPVNKQCKDAQKKASMHKILKCCRTEGVVCLVHLQKNIWFCLFTCMMLIGFDIKSKGVLCGN